MSAERRALSPNPVRLLLVGDSHDDHCLLCDLLDAVVDVRFSIDWAKDLKTGLERMEHGRFDACLIDHKLPDGNGLELLKTAVVLGFQAPIILMADQASAKLDQQAMNLGASGFLDKSSLDPSLLERTIRYAIRQQEIVQSLNRTALRDDVTGLVTPSLFRDRLTKALAYAKRRQSLVAVVLIEIEQGADQTLDKGLRDKRLALRAKHLTHRLRTTDTVARLADHRLGLILEDLQEPDNAALVTQKALDRLTMLASENGTPVIEMPTAGIALYPEDGGDVDTLLQRAATAMLRTKADESHRYRFSSDLMDRKAPRQFLRHNDLKHALDNETIALRYRPLVHIRTPMISLSAEIHLDSPENEPVPTARFLSIADDRSLVKKTTNWMVRKAVSQLQAWQQQNLGNIELSLPFISARASDLPFLEQALGEHLNAADIDPNHIEIDLDQALIAGDLATGGHGLTALKAIGIRLALDGFGRREVSIHNLANDRLDSLKLSSLLYRDLPGDMSQTTLLKSIINLGHDLDLRVVADGARDDRQFAFLKEAGCDAVKLRAAGSSLTADRFTNWLQKNRQLTGKPPKLAVRPERQSSCQRTPSAAIDIHTQGRLPTAETHFTDHPGR